MVSLLNSIIRKFRTNTLLTSFVKRKFLLNARRLNIMVLLNGNNYGIT